MGVHVSPPSIVFHKPPPTAPAYAIFGCPLTPLTVSERPARAGPRLRHWKAFRIAGSKVPPGAVCARSAV